MSQSHADTDFDNVETVQLVNTKVEDFISMGQLVESVQWINQHVVSKGAGFEMPIAKLYGWANVTSRQLNSVPGKPEGVESIKLSGEFEATSLITGEVVQAPHAYLPKKWAQLVEVAVKELDLANDPSAKVKMLLTVGVRATGKTIPYSWTVRTALPRSSPDLTDLRQLALGLNAPKRLAGGSGLTIEANAA